MMTESWEIGWGGWALGDLADMFRRVADLLGRSQDVSRVVLRPPEEADALPRIRVVVPRESALVDMRRQFLRGEYLVDFIGRPTDIGWTAEVAGMVLSVRLEDA